MDLDPTNAVYPANRAMCLIRQEKCAIDVKPYILFQVYSNIILSKGMQLLKSIVHYR